MMSRGMLHDEEVYHEPERFNPQRFDGVHANEEDPRKVLFGFGRRSIVWRLQRRCLST